MQTSLKVINEVDRKLIITVPEALYEQRFEARLREVARTAKLKGFRAGQAPLKEVYRQFKGDIHKEVMRLIMESCLAEVGEREGFEPIGGMDADIFDPGPGSDLRAVVTFQIFPEIDVSDFPEGITVYEPDVEITDQDIDRSIHKLRLRQARYREVYRPVRQGDRVTFVYAAGSADGKKVVEDDREVVMFMVPREEAMNERMHAENAEVLLGAEIGEFRPDPSNPKGHAPSGKKNNGIVVKKIEEVELPELDADFISPYRVEGGDLEGLRMATRDMLTFYAETFTWEHAVRQLVDQVAAIYRIPLPDALVQDAINEERDRMVRSMRRERDDNANSPDKALDDPVEALPDERFREQAEKSVIFRLVLSAIVEAQSITLDQERLSEKIRAIAQRSKDPQRAMEHIYEDRDLLDDMETQVLAEQAIVHIFDTANIVLIPCSFDQVLSNSFVVPNET